MEPQLVNAESIPTDTWIIGDVVHIIDRNETSHEGEFNTFIETRETIEAEVYRLLFEKYAHFFENERQMARVVNKVNDFVQMLISSRRDAMKDIFKSYQDGGEIIPIASNRSKVIELDEKESKQATHMWNETNAIMTSMQMFLDKFEKIKKNRNITESARVDALDTLFKSFETPRHYNWIFQNEKDLLLSYQSGEGEWDTTLSRALKQDKLQIMGVRIQNPAHNHKKDFVFSLTKYLERIAKFSTGDLVRVVPHDFIAGLMDIETNTFMNLMAHVFAVDDVTEDHIILRSQDLAHPLLLNYDKRDFHTNRFLVFSMNDKKARSKMQFMRRNTIVFFHPEMDIAKQISFCRVTPSMRLFRALLNIDTLTTRNIRDLLDDIQFEKKHLSVTSRHLWENILQKREARDIPLFENPKKKPRNALHIDYADTIRVLELVRPHDGGLRHILKNTRDFLRQEKKVAGVSTLERIDTVDIQMKNFSSMKELEQDSRNKTDKDELAVFQTQKLPYIMLVKKKGEQKWEVDLDYVHKLVHKKGIIHDPFTNMFYRVIKDSKPRDEEEKANSFVYQDVLQHIEKNIDTWEQFLASSYWFPIHDEMKLDESARFANFRGDRDHVDHKDMFEEREGFGVQYDAILQDMTDVYLRNIENVEDAQENRGFINMLISDVQRALNISLSQPEKKLLEYDLSLQNKRDDVRKNILVMQKVLEKDGKLTSANKNKLKAKEAKDVASNDAHLLIRLCTFCTLFNVFHLPESIMPLHIQCSMSNSLQKVEGDMYAFYTTYMGCFLAQVLLPQWKNVRHYRHIADSISGNKTTLVKQIQSLAQEILQNQHFRDMYDNASARMSEKNRAPVTSLKPSFRPFRGKMNKKRIQNIKSKELSHLSQRELVAFMMIRLQELMDDTVAIRYVAHLNKRSFSPTSCCIESIPDYGKTFSKIWKKLIKRMEYSSYDRPPLFYIHRHIPYRVDILWNTGNAFFQDIFQNEKIRISPPQNQRLITSNTNDETLSLPEMVFVKNNRMFQNDDMLVKTIRSKKTQNISRLSQKTLTYIQSIDAFLSGTFHSAHANDWNNIVNTITRIQKTSDNLNVYHLLSHLLMRVNSLLERYLIDTYDANATHIKKKKFIDSYQRQRLIEMFNKEQQGGFSFAEYNRDNITAILETLLLTHLDKLEPPLVEDTDHVRKQITILFYIFVRFVHAFTQHIIVQNSLPEYENDPYAYQIDKGGIILTEDKRSSLYVFYTQLYKTFKEQKKMHFVSEKELVDMFENAREKRKQMLKDSVNRMSREERGMYAHFKNNAQTDQNFMFNFFDIPEMPEQEYENIDNDRFESREHEVPDALRRGEEEIGYDIVAEEGEVILEGEGDDIHI